MVLALGTSAQAKSREARDGDDFSRPASGPPVMAIVALSEQHVTIYDAEGKLLRAPVSTGQPGYETPAGIYSILEKNREHYSNLYDDASMPFMQRITWSGIALHAGDLPGYPASHGCIRLTHDFAIRLWHLTKRGTRVVIAHDDIRPAEISNAKLFVPKPKVALASPPSDAATQPNPVAADATPAPLIANAKQEDAKDGTKVPAPVLAAATPQKGASITVFVSRKLSKLFVRQGFVPVFDAPVTIRDPAEPMGTHLFTAMELQNDGAAMRWTVVSVPEGSSHSQKTQEKSHKGRAKETIKTVLPTLGNANAAFNRIEIPQDAAERIAELLTPGSSLIISDYGISGETGTDTDFIVLTR
jgi:hypothetical protein